MNSQNRILFLKNSPKKGFDFDILRFEFQFSKSNPFFFNPQKKKDSINRILFLGILNGFDFENSYSKIDSFLKNPPKKGFDFKKSREKKKKSNPFFLKSPQKRIRV